MRKTKKHAPVRHAFLYKVTHPLTMKEETRKAWALVIPAKKNVLLNLTANHIRRSIKLHGVGNVATCTMAVCTVQHADKFSHPVEGYIDWTYTRAYVVSKVDKNGLPCECYCYEHSDEIAKLNDTSNGQRDLLKRILRDGPMTIELRPYRKRSADGRSGADRQASGVRSAEKRLSGAKLRHATVQLGVLPA